MKFGEALKLIFDAHYEDLASTKYMDGNENTRYTNKKLRAALALMPAKWRPDIMREFSIMRRVIEDEILKCPHNNRKIPYSTREECVCCGAHRNLEREDNDPHSYNDSMTWSEWRI